VRLLLSSIFIGCCSNDICMKYALALLTALMLFPGPVASHVAAPRAAATSDAGSRESDALVDRGLEVNGLEERGIVALDQSLRELTNPFTIVSVAAHVEDVDAGTLAYCRKKLGARTVIVLATRDEGRDSRTHGELDEERGAIRTGETCELAKALGADLYYLDLPDFGYSRSVEEALALWGRDNAVRRLVQAIRLLHPDVMITGDKAESPDGQRQAVAAVLSEAFASSANKKFDVGQHPDHWAPRRLFTKSDETAFQVLLDLSEHDHLRGRTYAEIGLSALRKLASLSPWPSRVFPERETSYYALAAFAELQKPSGASFLDGLRLPENLARSIAPPRVGDLSLTEAIVSRDKVIEALKSALVEKQAEGSAEVLYGRYGAEFFRVTRYTEAIQRSLALALGVTCDVLGPKRALIPGQKLSARVALHNGSDQPMAVAFITPVTLAPPGQQGGVQTSQALSVAAGATLYNEFEFDLPQATALTLPHPAHLREEQFYPLGSPAPGAQSTSPFGNRLEAAVEVGLGQAAFLMSAQTRYDIAPPVEISTLSFALLKDWSTVREFDLPVRVRNNTPGALAGALWIVPLALSEDDYEPAHLSFLRPGEELTIKMKLRLPVLKPPLSPDILIEFRREIPAPPTPLASAKIIVKAVDLDVAEGLRVGYVPGLDAWLATALTELGVSHTSLSVDEIAVSEHGNGLPTPAQSLRGCGDLGRFDAIIIDRQAYLARPELFSCNRCLLRYARQGGNLVVLSQQPDDWNLILSRSQWAPFPLRLSKERVAMQQSNPNLLDLANPVLSLPNKITGKDFAGWLREGAVFVPTAWAKDYTPLLEVADPGQEPMQGSLLVARFGEGSYVYVSLDFRRQLNGMNPGAYRLFANLLSLSKTARPPAK